MKSIIFSLLFAIGSVAHAANQTLPTITTPIEKVVQPGSDVVSNSAAPVVINTQAVTDIQVPSNPVIPSQPDTMPAVVVAPSELPIKAKEYNPNAERDLKRLQIIAETGNDSLKGWEQINTGDTAWMLAATALVMLMTSPGLALFYSGMSRRKNMISTAAMIFMSVGLIGVLWMTIGYSLAFGPGNGLIGDLSKAFMTEIAIYKNLELVSIHPNAPHIPEHLYMMFQMSFAIITPALIIGAYVERIKFSAMVLFTSLWSLCVYAPIAHWLWSPTGFLNKMGALDFAGGLVVHLSSGLAGLVMAYYLGPRKGHLVEPMPPANLVLTMTGAGLLLVGWFGFNAGSANSAGALSSLAFANTLVAACGGMLSWTLVEWRMRQFPSLLGMCSGVVAGLVAVTPAAGYVQIVSAAAIGVIAGPIGYFACARLKRLMGYDDSLDAFGIHGVCGFAGSILTGIFAQESIVGAPVSMVVQITSTMAIGAFAIFSTLMLAFIVDKTIGLRIDPDSEELGLDLSNHAEQVDS